MEYIVKIQGDLEKDTLGTWYVFVKFVLSWVADTWLFITFFAFVCEIYKYFKWNATPGHKVVSSG